MTENFPTPQSRSRGPHLRRVATYLVALGLIVFLVDFILFLSSVRHYSQLAETPPALPTKRIKKEAVVVLTGDRYRIPRALELMRTRGGPLLIISGVRKGTTLKEIVNLQSDSAGNIHEIWDRIILESHSGSTIENAYQTGKLLQERGLTRLILVTSEYHMKRSLEIFERVLPHVEIIPYPISSSVSNLGEESATRSFSALWFLWNEYWKSVLFRVVSRHRIHALDGA